MRELEGELRRLSDEVSTDALTQVANRRGLAPGLRRRARARRARRRRRAAAGRRPDRHRQLQEAQRHAGPRRRRPRR
ncbi:MAG: hypothetical protein MZW92_24690 [Comamonadaceae bacterium]|nr:hypothetical protein [Comamonadaceae bacterium]